MRNFFNDGIYEFLGELEQSYDCASICEVPLFYLTKDIREGKVTRECTQAIILSLESPVGIAGFVSIFLGLFLLIATLGTFPLCCSKPRNEMYKDDEGEEN